MLRGMHGYQNVQLPADAPDTLLYTVPTHRQAETVLT